MRRMKASVARIEAEGAVMQRMFPHARFAVSLRGGCARCMRPPLPSIGFEVDHGYGACVALHGIHECLRWLQAAYHVGYHSPIDLPEMP